MFLNMKTKNQTASKKRTSANSKEERDLIGKWIPKRYSNGETLPQILSSSTFTPLKNFQFFIAQFCYSTYCKRSNKSLFNIALSHLQAPDAKCRTQTLI